jgi:hypothetical protein
MWLSSGHSRRRNVDWALNNAAFYNYTDEKLLSTTLPNVKKVKRWFTLVGRYQT